MAGALQEGKTVNDSEKMQLATDIADNVCRVKDPLDRIGTLWENAQQAALVALNMPGYVLIEGGLVQSHKASCDLDLMDLDFLDSGDADSEDEARTALELTEKHGLTYASERVRSFIEGL